MNDLRSVFRLLPRRLRWRWVGLLPLVIMTAAVEAAAAAAIFGLLHVLTDPSLTSLTGLAWPLSLFARGSDWRAAVLSVTLAVMLLYACRLLALAFVVALKERIALASIVHLSDSVLSAFLNGPFSLVAHRTSADMQLRVERYSEVAVGLGISSVVQLAAEGSVVVALVVLLAVTAPLPTLFAVLATAGLLLLPAALTKRTFEEIAERERTLEERSVHQLRQGLGALREIRVYGRETFFRKRARVLREGLAHVQRRRLILSDVLRLTVETVFVVVLLIVIVVVTERSDTSDVVSLLGLYAYAGFRFVPSANRITMNLNSLRGALPHARELCQDLTGLARTDEAEESVESRLTFDRHIELADVGYHYGGANRPALSDICLTIERGESLGIVGPSGAGKSTMADLLLGLLTPTSGRILVDGHDIRNVRRSWQRHIGYVAQSFYLLDDTLRRNIAFGLESSAIDDDRILEVVRAAQLEQLVAVLPAGIETVIGEAGTRLSGGERQRVAIARALYSGPDVLVLDEATAALDPATERDVTEAIAHLKGTRTLIVIAHRMSTVQNCDRLVMLREGRVHACGSFDDLIANNDEFRTLVTADRRHG